MASTQVEQGQDYLSHHFDTSYQDKMLGDAKPLSYTTTEAPKSTRPMAFGRKIAAGLITLMHVYSLYAFYDMFFVLDAVPALKWFIASLAFYHFSGVQGITAGAHRLWAHRSYTANLPVRIWLMIMNSISNQGSILSWSVDHRVHHIHVDTDADPHNINRGFFFAHMGWLYCARTDAYAEAKKQVELSDLHNDGVVMFQEKYYAYLGPFFCYLLPALMGYYFAGDAWRGFIYLGALRWVITLHVTWCINSASHTFGTQNLYSNQKATENLFTSIFAGGEGWHNYHHTYPYDYAACEQTSLWQFGDKSGIDWRFNAARFWIDLFAALGGVSHRKVHRNLKGKPLQNPLESTVPAPHMRDELLSKKID